MRNRHDDTNGTLQRLNDALSTLEGRIGIASPQSQVSDDLSAIKARQAALETPRHQRTQTAPVMQNQAGGMSQNLLQNELHQLRADLQREMTGNFSAGFDSLRSELNSLQQSTAISAGAGAMSGTAKELRDDIAALKADVSRLAREDTLQELMERWTVVEREMANLPQTLGSRDELLAMADRLDNVQHSISTLPQTLHLDGVEEQVRTLALAIEHMAEHSGGAQFPIDAIDARFNEISRAIAAIPAPTEQPNYDVDAIERIEARISTVSRMLENDNMASHTEKLDNHFETLGNRLNIIQEETANLRAHSATAFPMEVFDRLEQRIDAVANKIDGSSAQSPVLDDQFADIASRLSSLQQETAGLKELSNNTVPTEVIDALGTRIEQLGAVMADGSNNSADTSNFDGVLNELNERLVYVIDKVNSNSDVAQETAQTLISSIDNRMEEISRRIDENENRSASVPSFDALENRLEGIAQMLASNDGSAAATPNISNLEAQVAQLTQSLSGGVGPIDQDSLLSAARMAADEAIARIGTNTNDPASENIHQLAGDLKTLETLARDSDDRNSRTFGAIHDTLLKVVDHLSSLENSIQSPDSSHVQERYQEEHHQEVSAPRMALDETPSLAPEEQQSSVPVFDDTEFEPTEDVQPPSQRSKLSPAAAAAAAAEAALKDSGSAPVRPQASALEVADTEEVKSKSLLKGMAQKLSRKSAPEAGVQTGPIVSDVELPSDDSLTISDEPIEPGSGGADLSEIMRRVREERSGGAVAAQSAQSVKDDSGKSDFIAAARRAAKAAAADATVVTREEKKKKTKGGSSIGSMLSTRRKPLLMGAGAILLALLAVPLIRGFVAPSDSPDQASLQNANPIVEDVTTAALPNAEGAVDDLELTVEEPIVENVEDAPVQANIADPMTPAPIGVDEIEQPDALTLDSVPEEVGPITLREAAISGDAKALYLVGDYYTGGVPGQSGADLAKALEWYKKSADLGYAPAQYRVGNFYEKAMGTERDLMAAKTWYQLAAEQGNAAAMHNLAVLFANGPDGTPDFESATRWFKSAAELGVKDSQFNLGILSAQGRGVPQDLAESYKWFAIAAKTGDPDAVAKRDEVADALRPDQLETARGATELWKAKELVESVNYVDIPDDWRTDAAATAATSKKAPQVDKAQMKKAIRNIQAILNNSGYDAGPVDGVMGGKTKTAIKAFQKANGMEPNGNVDQALVQKLIALNEKNKKS